ncbi:MAG: YegS/Rv2252/BmrU family lipid kinase [Oscillospiraceae bacterium]|nr:YegS/Rv2252/BmrU family lipid kinase [Oscillospiraceae bacterium]
MKKLLLIVNPTSGKKQASRYLSDIVGIFNRDGWDVTVYVTAEQGDAVRLVQERAVEFDRIVCAGGDGTFNETVSGLRLSGQRVPVGYIPAGSTNDFATSLKLSKNLKNAAADIVGGQPVPLDVGRFHDRHFSYIASFGIFTRTSYSTAQGLKNSLGHFAYLLSSIKEITSIRSYRLRFTLDDGQSYEDDYIFGAISNTTSLAGVLTLSPKLVDMSDGKFEIFLIRRPRTPLELSDCVLALTAQDYETPMLTLASSSRIEIDGQEEVHWSLDGEEAIGPQHFTVENLHHGIDILVNQGEKGLPR